MQTTDLIYSMLTTSTGIAICDSGGGNGRHWQRNANKSLEDFMSEPEATLNISQYKEGAEYDYEVTISVFHHLNKLLSQDSFCREYNAMPCENWDGDFYGVSIEQSEWLDKSGFTPKGDSWNTYNWDNNLSQVLQGQHFERDDNMYVLVQIHQGADVRGGYTDAKLFLLSDGDEWRFMDESCGFTIGKGENTFSLDYHSGNDFMDSDGNYLDTDTLNELAAKYGAGEYEGGLFY